MSETDLRARAATAQLRRVPASGPDAVAAVERYYAELRTLFPDGFDPGPSDLDAGVFVVASIESAVVACGGVQPLDEGTGEVKRMWVDPAWRGAGLASRLLRHLEGAAREAGHTRLMLDTSDRLTAAIAMYERAGYVEVAAYNDNPYARRWFAKALS